MKTEFKGIIPAFVTPLNDDNTVKEKSTRELLNLQIKHGADGFYICGATGEGVVMQPKARMDMCEICVDEVKGRVPIIDHIAAIDATTSIELAKHADRCGVDCIASIPPFYFNYSENDIVEYYKRLAGSVSVPVMIYYVPRGGVLMSAQTVARIFNEVENVTAVKWSSSNYFEMMNAIRLTDKKINLINGPDETLICGLASGADAGIGATYNVMLPWFKELYENFCIGNVDAATEAQQKINRIIGILMRENVISAVKELVTRSGIDVGSATFPMKAYTKEESDKLLKECMDAGWTPLK